MSSFLAGRPWCRLLATVAIVCALTPSTAFAQTPADTPTLTRDLPEADFYFGEPRGSIGVRGSLLVPGERSDLFDFLQNQLTIDRGDFRSAAFGADLAFTLTPRIDLVGSMDISRKTVASEYRDFVDNELLPIEQRTSLRQAGVTASVRYALAPRGERIGRFAWIPSRVQPYVGAGGGLIFWRFQQEGDFVDYEDGRVFPEFFSSNGISPTAHALGGLDIVVYKRMLFTLEGRYQWARGDLENDFIGFEPIDLSGVRASAGFRFVF
ncbi:MAG: hypothetical protein IT178_12175 [Acidobacteria bacterium]|nr:hypothetical protein [Acidobacteriota bacterium]